MSDAHPDRFFIMPKNEEAALESIVASCRRPLVSKGTPLTSLGSCFADNVRMFLKSHGYNYLHVEPGAEGVTANWGRVYNSGSLRQIFQYSASQTFRPAERWWTTKDGKVADPYRPVSDYASVEEAERDFDSHMQCSREALSKADVVMLTLGLIETWRSKLDGSYFHGRPISYDPARHEFHVMGYDEVYRDLIAVTELAKALNPSVSLVLTVSPVPLKASFREDVSPVSASAYSKSVLVAAVHSFCRENSDCLYFPSFEMVRDVFAARVDRKGSYDPAVIERVMGVFEQACCY